jgi:hypothetical protein
MWACRIKHNPWVWDLSTGHQSNQDSYIYIHHIDPSLECCLWSNAQDHCAKSERARHNLQRYVDMFSRSWAVKYIKSYPEVQCENVRHAHSLKTKLCVLRTGFHWAQMNARPAAPCLASVRSSRAGQTRLLFTLNHRRKRTLCLCVFSLAHCSLCVGPTAALG